MRRIRQRELHLHESLQLVKLEVQLQEAVLEQFPQLVVVHDLHQHTERLLLRHLTNNKTSK